MWRGRIRYGARALCGTITWVGLHPAPELVVPFTDGEGTKADLWVQRPGIQNSVGHVTCEMSADSHVQASSRQLGVLSVVL